MAYEELYCFLMLLGHFRMQYVEFVTDMSTNTLIRCYQNVYRYFGGDPSVSGHEKTPQTFLKIRSVRLSVLYAVFVFLHSVSMTTETEI